MPKSRRLWALAVVLGLIGCAGEEPSTPVAGGPVFSKSTSPGKEKAPVPSPAPGKAEKNDGPPLEPPRTDASKETARPVSLTDAQIAKIRTLPAAEQDAALQQAVCPVSGGHLGSMGTPYRITVENRTFYLCCDSCVDKVQADPKGIIAKLDKK
jgi:hypothetical protein